MVFLMYSVHQRRTQSLVKHKTHRLIAVRVAKGELRINLRAVMETNEISLPKYFWVALLKSTVKRSPGYYSSVGFELIGVDSKSRSSFIYTKRTQRGKVNAWFWQCEP